MSEMTNVMISREEMIRMVQDTRKKVTSGEVSEAELAEYPVMMEKLEIPTGEGTADVYYSYTEKLEHEDVLIINFHGGGFIKGRTACDELFCRRMNHLLGCKVMDVDYLLAPEHPYPAAVNESFDVVVWLFEHCGDYGVRPDRIILMGHSAGGNLVIVTQMQLLERKLPWRPLALAIEYPPLDLYTDPDDKKKMGRGIPAERAKLYNLYYCDRERQSEPYASPVYASKEQLRDFPPTLISTAGQDDLCIEAEEFALKLARSGNEVTLKRVPGAGHAYTVYRKEKHEEGFRVITGYVKKILDCMTGRDEYGA